MVGSFFSRLGQVFGGGTSALPPVAPLFAKALGAGMAGRIASYVADGSSSSVLSDLSVQTTQRTWQNRSRTYPQRDEHGLFRSLSAWQVDQMHRLGEVIALLDPITWDYGHFGTKASPTWLRHVVSLWLSNDRKGQPLQVLRDLAREGGVGDEAVIDVLFSRDAANYHSTTSIDRFAGVKDWLREHPAEVMTAAGKSGAEPRAKLAGVIGQMGLHGLYFPLLLDMATGSAKGPRKAANQALTGADPVALEAALEARFASDPPARRALLVESMAGALGDRAAPLIARLREAEKSGPVLAAMDRVAGAVAASAPQAAARSLGQQDGKAGFIALDGEWIAAPPRGDLPPPGKIDPEALALLLPVIEAYNTKMLEDQARYKDVKHHWTRTFKPHTAAAIDKLRLLAEKDHVVGFSNQNNFQWLFGYMTRHANIDRFFDHPSVDLRHLVRMAMGMNARGFAQLFNEWSGPASQAIQRRVERGADLRVLYDVWLENGGEKFNLNHYNFGAREAFGPQSWPFFVEHASQLDEALGLVPQSGQHQLDTYIGLKVLGLFPKVPERYRSRLMILANETSWQTREKARDLLRGAEGIEDSIALQLEDGNQTVRANAAQWLVARGAKSHIPAIRKRLKAEKSDKARAAMITALERLGDDTSDFFDQQAMLKEAEAGLKKAMPKGLDWFPFDALPALTWADGTPVDPMLPRYWVVLAARLKEPGGNALIDLWLDRLAPGDEHKLGWLVLTGWITEDTRMPTEEEGNQYALANVDAVLAQNHQNIKRWPQSAAYFSLDRDTVFAQLKRGKTSVYLGTATDSKGILALASRVNGADAAPRIRSFLKDHGARTSQARALLDVLASIGTPAALQVLLSTADRLKQKSVQAHARKLIEDVAEQRGWTPGELADRTVPTGGLDEDGVLELDCGLDRMYTARLDEEDKLTLFNASGKEVKALPAARIDDENALINAAKKALSNARKEVKQVVTAQTERLREAMCMERAWSGEDWLNYVAKHPILGRLAARLVWLGLDADGVVSASFRPLGDGTFTDASDGDVDPAGFETVKLAHSTLLTTEAIAAWQTHLADYAVTPLFDQLGRSLPAITEKMRNQRAITDREGWMIETFRLRGIATKLGYQRGPAEDGGWFMTYNRSLREAGLVAEIEFTGSSLPEENIPASLIALSFKKLLPNGRSGSPVDLGLVPEVLLAESWRDLYDIADKGTGFDKEWQKKGGL